MHKVWQRWSERVDGKIRDGIRIVLDLEQSIESSEAVDTLLLPVSNQAQESQVGRSGRGGVKVVDVSYGALMPHAEKSKSLLTNDQTLYCSACGRTAEKECELVVTCPQSFCLGVSHMRCLANQFISAESPEDMIVPVEGNCPSCKSRVRWIDVVKELSLRAHGHAELTKLSKRPREAKHRVSKAKRAEKGPSNVMPESRVISEDEFTSDAPAEDMPEIPVPALHFYGRMHCEPEDNDDIVSISSLTSIDSQETLSIRIPRVSAAFPSAIPKAVIEDSDWDGAEVLD